MKKLLYILLFVPLLGYCQLTQTNGFSLITNFSIEDTQEESKLLADVCIDPVAENYIPQADPESDLYTSFVANGVTVNNETCIYTGFTDASAQDLYWPLNVNEINTGSNSSYFIPSVTLDGETASSSYTLGAFYLNDAQEFVCGGFSNYSGNALQIAVMGDDTTTDEKDGFYEGEEIVWFALSTSDSIVYNASISAEAVANTYSTNGVNFISAFNISSAISGCSDPLALNYFSLANIDAGNCIIAVYGCQNPQALNYNPEAIINDGSCIAVAEGCIDATAFNYNELANTDDGSCIAVVEGCIDETAFNYNELANTDDGSCYRFGCISEWADNYDEFATGDDGSCELVACNYPYFFEFDSNYTISNPLLCITLIIEGCTNSDAENYNEEANLDDGSCVVLGCTYPNAENYNPAATIQDNSCIYYGCTNTTAENFNEQATDNDGSCIIYGCILSVFPNYNPEATIDDNSCSFDGLDIYGCTDPLALNYESQASLDNGSCLFNEEVESCSYSIEEEYIPLYLPQGWGMFGYTCLEPIDASEAFASIVDLLNLVKNNSGDVYIPEYNYNSLGDLTYSRGYQIYFTQEIIDFSFCPTIIVTENTPQREVGDLAEGGIVFYVDETGQHGLVAAMEDLGAYEWGCYGTDLAGADGQAIGTGYQNTLDIVSGCSETNTAAFNALNSTTEGYSDWYLPSKDELYEMYSTIGQGGLDGNVGGFETSDWPYYWSSSESSYNYAWLFDFDNGFAPSINKSYTYRVRVIRAF